MLLYHNMVEYSRVIEEVEVIEDGMFVKDQTPEDYGGAKLKIEVVHQITFVDAAGCIQVMKLDNPTPLNKEKKTSTASISLDGKEHRPGSSPAREWTTKKAEHLPQKLASKANETIAIMESDGESGTTL